MRTYETIAKHEVPGRNRYVQITRCTDTGQYIVSLRDNEDRIVHGQNYGNAVLIQTSITTEERARKMANAVWSHCRNHNNVQQIAQVMVALKDAGA